MYAEIIPSIPLNLETLTYKVPKSLESKISIGSIIEVPFKTKMIRGLVVNLTNNSPRFKTRELSKLSNLRLTKNNVKVIKWISEFYYCTLFSSARLFLPTHVWNPSTKKTQKVIDELGSKETDSNHLEEFVKKSKQLLKKEQENVFNDIAKSTQALHLLHGVTGSGKTEVYLHLIHEKLHEGKQCLILLPEISLTPQMSNYFENVFGENIVSVVHSEQTPAERTKNWFDIYTGKKRIVIGARSALFSPFKDLGLIVIDEAHDDSFKQDSSPRYNAKRVAAKIAALENIKVVYGSATPNVETYHSAKNTEALELNELTQKIAGESKRQIYIIDLKEEWKKKNYSIFSELLIEKIKEKLSKKEQIILFVNRRGFASSMICRDCGYKATCETCGIPYTYHTRNNTVTLECHHCGHIKKPELNCPVCKSFEFKLTGVGTEKVEKELSKLFKDARILRADRDSTKKRGSIKEMYETFKNGEADILVGTQMIAKGWDIENVTLVGVVLADIGLNIPDFRSSEKIFQLLTQVAGRTARGNKHGEVIIQTFNPENTTITAAAKDDYLLFYEEEIKQREKFKFPPYSRIIQLDIDGKSEQSAQKKARAILETLRAIDSKKQYSMFIAKDFIFYKANKYHFNIYVQGSNPNALIKKLLAKDPKISATVKITKV